MRPRILTDLALAGALFLLAGCAQKPSAGDPEALAEYEEANDPLEPTNRKFYAVNDALDRNVLRPAAVGYRKAVPETVRVHVHHFLSNLNNPAQLSNDVLQGKPRKAGNTLMRLLINSTVGLVGIFDVASDWGFPDHDTDFGLTLSVWGIPEGPFLFLPVLGPTNPRDAVGYGVNTPLDPLTWLGFPGSSTFGWTRFGAAAVDSRERVLDATDSIHKTALDPYATYRSLYTQSRNSAMEAAKKDLPATVPVWFPQAEVNPAPPKQTLPLVSPELAPRPSVEP
ncbi:MAG: VacJ family lipoprotein [Acetobacteraceae bacterium]|nr:VacJ family lipoprotein [Acetobacteraceae bacterium]